MVYSQEFIDGGSVTNPFRTYVEVHGLSLGQEFKDFYFLSILFFVGDPAAEEWSQWSVCSLTCGQGWQVRSRSCVSSPYGTLCSGPLRETRLCNNTATCPGEPQHQAGRVPPCLWMPIYTFPLSHTLHEQVKYHETLVECLLFLCKYTLVSA